MAKAAGVCVCSPLRGGPEGWNWGLGTSGNLKVSMDSTVVSEHSAKDAQGLTSGRLGHTLGPRNTDQAGESPEVQRINMPSSGSDLFERGRCCSG